MAWLYFNTCIATFVWLSTGLSLLILISLAYMLKLNCY
jgi:heme exporter protein D